MPRIRALLVGINEVDGSSPAYAGLGIPTLAGAVNDAVQLAGVYLHSGVDEVRTLLDGEAERDAILWELLNAARQLVAGDTYLLHFSGHGFRGLPRPIGADQWLTPEPGTGWIAHDGPITDGDLYGMLSFFRTGVRVVITSDSCHSGQVVRPEVSRAIRRERYRRAVPRGLTDDQVGRLHANLASRDGEADPPWRGHRPEHVPTAAVALLAACGVEETALDLDDGLDGQPHGLFSSCLLDALSADPTRSIVAMQEAVYRAVRSRASAVGHEQGPRLYPLGDPVEAATLCRSRLLPSGAVTEVA